MLLTALSFAEVCILALICLNTESHTNQFHRICIASWDMVTSCSGCCLRSMSRLLSAQSSDASDMLRFPPWWTLDEALHSACRWKVSAPCHQNPKESSQWHQPTQSTLSLSILFSWNTWEHFFKSIVKNTNDWKSYLGLHFGYLDLGHPGVSTALGTETRCDFSLQISHRCPSSI